MMISEGLKPVLINLSAFAAGLVFSFGLSFSGMLSPAKVLSFLDIAGAWDPSLALVMIGALLTLLCLQIFIFRRSKPILEPGFQLPQAVLIDRRLLSGAALFGIGWGMVGLCPGPALVNLVTGNSQIYWFVAAMLLGMGLAERFNK